MNSCDISPLMNLPSETRVEILKYLLYHPEPFRCYSSPKAIPKAVWHGGFSAWDFKTSSELGQVHNFTFQPQVLRVCRRLHNEGYDILYKQNVLSISILRGHYSCTEWGRFRALDIDLTYFKPRLQSSSTFIHNNMDAFETLLGSWESHPYNVTGASRKNILLRFPSVSFEIFIEPGAGHLDEIWERQMSKTFALLRSAHFYCFTKACVNFHPGDWNTMLDSSFHFLKCLRCQKLSVQGLSIENRNKIPIEIITSDTIPPDLATMHEAFEILFSQYTQLPPGTFDGLSELVHEGLAVLQNDIVRVNGESYISHRLDVMHLVLGKLRDQVLALEVFTGKYCGYPSRAIMASSKSPIKDRSAPLAKVDGGSINTALTLEYGQLA